MDLELAAIANATGLVPDRPGMHGPAATLDTLSKVLVPQKDGGVLSRAGVVDYSIGKGVAPGVFVVAEMSHPRVRDCYRAWIMSAPDAREAQAIPCGLLHGAKVTKPIAKGHLITTANTQVPAGSKIAELRARQDKLVYGH